VEELDTLQKGQQPRTALPNAAISPFGNPFDKILRQIAHSEHSSSHTICRKISLSVSPSSAHVRRRRRILNYFDSLRGRRSCSLPPCPFLLHRAERQGFDG